MEGGGLFTSAIHHDTPCVLVKGVCDWGQGKSSLHADKAIKKKIQAGATTAACHWLFHALVQARDRDGLPPLPFSRGLSANREQIALRDCKGLAQPALYGAVASRRDDVTA